MDVGFNSPTDADFAGQKIMTIGDINDDKWLDVITTNTDGTEITANYYDKDLQAYVPSTPFMLEYSSVSTT